jgi:hypothetical protein
MTPQTAQQRLTELQISQRPYVANLLPKLAVTYLVPLGVALGLATVGAVILANFIPSSTATAIVFALNVGVFYYGWNWLEKRTQATGLFTLFVSGSRERRALATLIQNAQKGDARAKDDLAVQVQRYDSAVQAFIERSTSRS